jgi:hypothetical protein
MAAYEPTGAFVDIFTEEELLQMRTAAKEVFLTEGAGQVVNWASTGSSATTRYSFTAEQMLAECQYALRQLDPSKYPSSSTDRTVVKFR